MKRTLWVEIFDKANWCTDRGAQDEIIKYSHEFYILMYAIHDICMCWLSYTFTRIVYTSRVCETGPIGGPMKTDRRRVLPSQLTR